MEVSMSQATRAHRPHVLKTRRRAGRLCLSRASGEQVVLLLASGQVVTVDVLARRKGRVRLAIGAPETVRIFRREVIDRARPARRVEGGP
jgi:carbon storage regulator CsrA